MNPFAMWSMVNAVIAVIAVIALIAVKTPYGNWRCNSTG
jgi:hypothetical protein